MHSSRTPSWFWPLPERCRMVSSLAEAASSAVLGHKSLWRSSYSWVPNPHMIAKFCAGSEQSHLWCNLTDITVEVQTLSMGIRCLPAIYTFQNLPKCQDWMWNYPPFKVKIKEQIFILKLTLKEESFCTVKRPRSWSASSSPLQVPPTSSWETLRDLSHLASRLVYCQSLMVLTEKYENINNRYRIQNNKQKKNI